MTHKGSSRDGDPSFYLSSSCWHRSRCRMVCTKDYLCIYVFSRISKSNRQNLLARVIRTQEWPRHFKHSPTKPSVEISFKTLRTWSVDDAATRSSFTWLCSFRVTCHFPITWKFNYNFKEICLVEKWEWEFEAGKWTPFEATSRIST